MSLLVNAPVASAGAVTAADSTRLAFLESKPASEPASKPSSQPRSATSASDNIWPPPVSVPGINRVNVFRCSFFTASGQQVKPPAGSAIQRSGSTTTVALHDGTRKTLAIGSVGNRYALYSPDLKRAVITSMPNNTAGNGTSQLQALAQRAVSTPGMKALLSQVRVDAVKAPVQVTSIKQLQFPYSVQASKGQDLQSRHVDMGRDGQDTWWAAVPKSAARPVQYSFIKLGTDQQQSATKLKVLLNDEKANKVPFVFNDLNRVVANSYDRAPSASRADKETFAEWRDTLIAQVTGNLPPVAKEMVGVLAGAGLEIGGKLVFSAVELADLASAMNKRLTQTDASWSRFVNNNFGGADIGSKAMQTLLKDRPTGGATDPKYVGAVVLAAAKKAGVWGMSDGSADQAAQAIGKGLVGMVKSELSELDPKTHTHDNMGAYIGAALGKLVTFWVPAKNAAIAEAKALASGVKISKVLASEVGTAPLMKAEAVLKAAAERLSKLKVASAKLPPQEVEDSAKLAAQLTEQSKAAATAASAGDSGGFQKAVSELEQTLKSKPAATRVPPAAPGSLQALGEALKIRVFANNSASLGNAKLFETLIEKLDGQRISAIRSMGLTSVQLSENTLAMRTASYKNIGAGQLRIRAPTVQPKNVEAHDLHTVFGGASKLGEVNANSRAFGLYSTESWADRGLLPGQGKTSRPGFWVAEVPGDFKAVDASLSKLESSTFNLKAAEFEKSVVGKLRAAGFIPKGSPLATRLERIEAQLMRRDALQAQSVVGNPEPLSAVTLELRAANSAIETSLKEVTNMATQARGELLTESLGSPATTYRLTTEHAAVARYMHSVGGDTNAVFNAAKYKKILATVKAEAGSAATTGLNWHRELVKTYAANPQFAAAMESNPAMKSAWAAYKANYGI